MEAQRLAADARRYALGAIGEPKGIAGPLLALAAHCRRRAFKLGGAGA